MLRLSRNVKLLLWWILPIFCALNAGAQSNTILQTDFEGPSVSLGWDAMEACCSYTMNKSTQFKRTGANSLRIELRKSDPDIGGNKRAELTDNSYPIPSETNRRWWSFSNYLPADFVRDSVHEILAQWHYRATKNYVSASPPLSLQIYKGDWIVELRYDSVDINNDNGANIKLVSFNLGPWQRGVWNDWVFNYNYSADNDGSLKVWKNGQLVIDYKGKNFYRGSYDPFFKIGLYRWVWSSTWPSTLEQSVLSSRVYYIDNIKIGNQQSILQDFQVPNPVPANIAPVATAGGKQTLPVPYYTATIKGSGSTDPDGSIVSYQWYVEEGANMPVIDGVNAPDLKVSRMVQGNYRYRLTVTDNQGAKSSSSEEVVITGSATVNKNPLANAGTTKLLTLPTNSVQLSAAGSSDPDGSIATYEWSQETGPYTAVITNPNTVNPTVSALQKGSYYFKLKVTDNSGAFSTDYVQVYVDGIAALPNVAPVADAGADITITHPDSTVLLSGSKSFDTDGTITGYSWKQDSGPAAANLLNATTNTATAGKLLAGNYVFSLIVTDNQGATDTAFVKVTVNPLPTGVNLPPVANAGPNQTFAYFYNTFTLKGNGSYDPDGAIVSYQWTQDSGPAVLISTPDSAGTIVRNVTMSGTYVFRLTVTDNLGLKNSSVMTITVTPALDGVSGIPVVNTPPVANAGTGATFPLLYNTISLKGNGSYDPDGSIVSYRWIQESGPSLQISSADSVFALARNPVVGSYVFRLITTDNKGGISSANVSFNILPPARINAPPVANAGSGQTFPLLYSTITMNGGLSTDSDGVIVKYQWAQDSGPAVVMSYPDSVVNVARNIVVGTYVFRLIVTDNEGSTDTAFLTVNILPPTTTTAASTAGNAAPLEQAALGYTAGGEQWKWGNRTGLVFPNPARNQVILKMNTTYFGRVNLRIYSLQGALLNSESFDKSTVLSTHVFQLGGIPAGTYIIQVWQGAKPLFSQRVSKSD